MPNYNYECNTCKAKAHKKHASLLQVDSQGERYLPKDLYESLVLFETAHSIKPTPDELYDAIECPRCGGHDCIKTLYGSETHGWVRGYGWLDRAGVKRDMNRYTLANNDPYAQYRVSGEVDYLDKKLKNEGKHNPQTKYFTGSSKSMEKAVKKAISSN
jgi:DNA-directed RNA polymerase subunit RPC12/RpoP